jgi:hypothetical protein
VPRCTTAEATTIVCFDAVEENAGRSRLLPRHLLADSASLRVSDAGIAVTLAMVEGAA